MARNKKVSEPDHVDIGVLEMQDNQCELVGSFDDALKFYQKRGKPVPHYATEHSAGFDLRVDIEPGDVIKKYDHSNRFVEQTVRNEARIFLDPGDRALIPTGLHADIPERYYIAIHPRSGTSWKQGLKLTNSVAVIDADYVEEIFISITNDTGTRVVIEDGDRIAQGLVMPAIQPPIETLENKPSQKTSRVGGFGSTGSK